MLQYNTQRETFSFSGMRQQVNNKKKTFPEVIRTIMQHMLGLNNFNLTVDKQKDAPWALLKLLHTQPSTHTNYKTRTPTRKIH